jgi:phytoene dehydrogenase-like protein
VLSNIGPDATVELAGGESMFSRDYIDRLHTDALEAPILHASFVMDRPLIEGFDGCMVLGNTRNLIYLEIPSEIAPGMSPAGTFLHTAYGAPADAAKPDMNREFENMLEELEQNFPGVREEAHFLVKAKHRGESPGMRRWVGRCMPVDTSVAGLFNVGDGCAPSGHIGTEGAAASARDATAMILER